MDTQKLLSYLRQCIKKYNMIEKDAVLKLYNSGKIRDIENIESVVLNY